MNACTNISSVYSKRNALTIKAAKRYALLVKILVVCVCMRDFPLSSVREMLKYVNSCEALNTTFVRTDKAPLLGYRARLLQANRAQFMGCEIEKKNSHPF